MADRMRTLPQPSVILYKYIGIVYIYICIKKTSSRVVSHGTWSLTGGRLINAMPFPNRPFFLDTSIFISHPVQSRRDGKGLWIDSPPVSKNAWKLLVFSSNSMRPAGDGEEIFKSSFSTLPYVWKSGCENRVCALVCMVAP